MKTLLSELQTKHDVQSHFTCTHVAVGPLLSPFSFIAKRRLMSVFVRRLLLRSCRDTLTSQSRLLEVGINQKFSHCSDRFAQSRISLSSTRLSFCPITAVTPLIHRDVRLMLGGVSIGRPEDENGLSSNTWRNEQPTLSQTEAGKKRLGWAWVPERPADAQQQ